MESGIECILSAGIDIGTSTTKLIISRLALANTAGFGQVPRIQIVAKEILYKSPIYPTPLYSSTMVNIEAVMEIVRQEYQRAGIKPEQIQTGAVIITGETATKRNAEEAVHLLSNQAGEFLVATAGPDLEGVIAAKGSGAYQYAKQTGKTVANIDIGGGTANIAVYEGEELRGTCTLHIGGRLLTFSGDTVSHISAPIQKLLDQNGWTLAVGDSRDKTEVQQLAEALATTLANILQGKVEANDQVLLLGHPPNWHVNIEAIMFSGGVSDCLFHHDRAAYDDLGTLIAKALRNHSGLMQWAWIPPTETVRATVLGAGTQTTEISGATICVESSRLPIKNIPVQPISMAHTLQHAEQTIRDAVLEAIKVFDPYREGRNFALYLSHLPVLRFQEIRQLATWFMQAYALQPNQGEPMILVMAEDYAKVFGQTLQSLQAERQVICIDQIALTSGDYVDIGKKLKSGVVPVVVKTLAFHS